MWQWFCSSIKEKFDEYFAAAKSATKHSSKSVAKQAAKVLSGKTTDILGFSGRKPTEKAENLWIDTVFGTKKVIRQYYRDENTNKAVFPPRNLYDIQQ